jgi:diadenosine tetraphosphate (Ap4A) HIT family hydrolase
MPLIVRESPHFLIEQCESCPLPGYLILHVQGGCQSLAGLDPEWAAELGAMLARTARAIEAVVRPDRIYTMMFAEVKREIHFHLFPRTDWLLQQYWDATGTRGLPVDGPALFQWAREQIVPGGTRVPEGPSVAEAQELLRAALN